MIFQRSAATRLAPALMAAAIGTAMATAPALAASEGQPAAGPAGMAVAAGDAVIAAPDTVDPGQTVNIIVDGAPLGSRIEVWGPVTQSGMGGKIGDSVLVGGVAELAAPQQSASYEIRYVSPEGKTMARQAFDVAAVPVVLTVLTPVDAGSSMEVRWQGPAAPGDRFEIAGPSGQVLDSVPVAGDPAAENVSTLTMPQTKGRMELRYVTGDGAMLRSVGFDVQ